MTQAERRIFHKYGSNFDFWHIDDMICESQIFTSGKAMVSNMEVNKVVVFDI